MKKLSFILVFLLAGCVVEAESTDTVEEVYEEDTGSSMPGNGQGGTYSQNCGFVVEEIHVGDETHYISIPIFCDPYWWIHTPPGDPPPENEMENPYSNPHSDPQDY